MVLATGDTYTVTANAIGKSLSVTASYTDALGTAESMSSAATDPVKITGLPFTGTVGDDQLLGNVGNDTLVGNAGNDLLRGSTGNDQLNGEDGNDRLFGNVGNDVLNGGNDDDQLSGNSGKDKLNGGLGNDVLIGGAGKDSFIFNTEPLANIDTLLDFVVADDTILLENSIFTAFNKTDVLAADQLVLGAAALDGNDFILYDADNGTLFYDADGNGAGAAQPIATLGTSLPVTQADFVVI